MGKTAIIFFVAYMTVFTFLTTSLFSGQPLIAIIFACFIVAWFHYWYRYDHRNNQQIYAKEIPITQLSLIILTIILLL